MVNGSIHIGKNRIRQPFAHGKHERARKERHKACQHRNSNRMPRIRLRTKNTKNTREITDCILETHATGASNPLNGEKIIERK